VIRDYIHVTDIASALTKALTYSGETRIFNIGSGVGHNLNEVIQVIESITAQPLRVKYTESRSFDVPINVLDISRARKDLNWKPTVSFQEGIARVYAWMHKEYKGSST